MHGVKLTCWHMLAARIPAFHLLLSGASFRSLALQIGGESSTKKEIVVEGCLQVKGISSPI